MRRKKVLDRRPDAGLSGGFTLIELMIAVVVIAILASIAIPSYTEYVRRGTRADAQSYLMEVSLLQQQHLVDRRRYAATLGALGTNVPASIAGKYDITIVVDNAGAPRFTLSATPQGQQAGEACGTMTLNNTGAKTPAHCW